MRRSSKSVLSCLSQTPTQPSFVLQLLLDHLLRNQRHLVNRIIIEKIVLARKLR